MKKKTPTTTTEPKKRITIRPLAVTVQLQAAADDGETLRALTLPPFAVEARDLAQLPARIEAARLKFEEQINAAPPRAPAK